VKVCSKCFTETPDETRFCPNCGEALPAEDGEEPKGLIGTTIAGKFLILSAVGEGAMGSIYKAEQTTLSKMVCIKVLHPHLSGDRTISKRFHREARAASRIKHPNAINIIDFGTAEDGTHYIAMDFIDGQDLAHLIKGQFPIETERAFYMTDQVCSALDDAHAQGVIHRDLKPENIMVEDRRRQNDFVTVLDFGIAKITDPSGESADTFHTMAGIVCGTPEYMSPEQARGEPLDARSDIYSLGVIMYHMFTGKLPFTADTPIGVVTKHLTQEPVKPREIRPDLHPAVEKLILRLMAKDREVRPASCHEVKDVVEEVRKAIAAGDGFDQTAPMARPTPEELGQTAEKKLSTSPYAEEIDEDSLIPAGKPRTGLWLSLVGVVAVCTVAGLYFFGPLGSLGKEDVTSEQATTEGAGDVTAGKGEQPSGEQPGKGGTESSGKAPVKSGMTPEEMLKLAGQMAAYTRNLGEYQVEYAQNDRMLAMRLEEWKKRENAEKVAELEKAQQACAVGRERVTKLQEKVETGDLTGADEAIAKEDKLVKELNATVEALLAEELPAMAGQEDQAGKKVADLTSQISASRKELADQLASLDEKKAAWAKTPESKPVEELEALQNSLRTLDGEYGELLAGLTEETVSKSGIQYGKRLGKQDVYKEQVAAALARKVGPSRAELEKQAAAEKHLQAEKQKRDEEKRQRDEEKRKLKEAQAAKDGAAEAKRLAQEKAAADKAAKEARSAKAKEFEELGDEAKGQGSYAKAIAYYKQSSKLRSSAGLHKKLGKTYNSKGDYANGAKHLRKYLSIMGSKLSPSARKLIESQIRD
jgi:serine/threonine protein kinase